MEFPENDMSKQKEGLQLFIFQQVPCWEMSKFIQHHKGLSMPKLKYVVVCMNKL